MNVFKRLLVLILCPLCLFAQKDYVFQHLTIEDGLLSNSKTNVLQDAEGFYWFASENGIQKYDGQNFITYKFSYPENKTITNEWIGKPVEDKEKNIWVLNAAGINIFKRKERKLIRLYMSDAVDSNANNVAGIIKGKQDDMWIITSKNIFKYDYGLRKPVLYSKIIGDDKSGIFAPQYDEKRNCFWLVFIGASTKIASFNIDKKQIIYPLKSSVEELLGHKDLISFFYLDKGDNLWMSNYIGDLCKYNINTTDITPYAILHERALQKTTSPNSAITGCIDDENGVIWFSGDYYLGLLKYDKQSGVFAQIQNDNGSEYGLHYNEKMYSFSKDNDGNIWINTDLGMNIFNPQYQAFKYLKPAGVSSVTQFSIDVSSIFQSSSGDIWISTWGDGIFKYDSNFNLCKHYVHDNNNTSSLGEPYNRTWCFQEDKKGKIWVGCQYGMLSILDTVTGKFTNKKILGFSNTTIMRMVKDRHDNIWFGLYSGLIAKYDAAADTIIVYNNSFKKKPAEVSPVDALCVDNNDNIWWCPGANGIREFDTKKNIVADTALFSLHVSSPSFLNDSVMMGGIDGKGFFLYNTVTKAVHFFTTSNGLLSNNVFGAVASSPQTIWIFTSNGIQSLNKQNEKILTYDVNEGIRDHELEGPFCKLRNGTIVFAAKSGVVYFNPKDIKIKSAPHDVLITAFNTAQKNLSVDSLLQNKNISLHYDENLITIQYASVSFAGRKTDQYFYQLQGVNKGWIAAGTQRSVTYSNLSPGNYIFKVKAANDGATAKHITQLSIIINPPWWQTWWAYLLWVLIAVLIVYSIYDYRKRNRKALADMRQKIASDLHDDIGSTLNSISVYSEIAGNQLQSNPEGAKNILDKMGGASRNMIDVMNDIVWAVHPKNDQFENVLQRMQYFAGELLSGKNMLLHFNADEKLKSIKLPMEKRKNFYLIFKEAVTNAYKYSCSKNLNVVISLEDNILKMIVADEGIGFETAKKSLAGNGLKNMQQRAKEINAQLQINSSKHKGTFVQLNMRVK